MSDLSKILDVSDEVRNGGRALLNAHIQAICSKTKRKKNSLIALKNYHKLENRILYFSRNNILPTSCRAGTEIYLVFSGSSLTNLSRTVFDSISNFALSLVILTRPGPILEILQLALSASFFPDQQRIFDNFQIDFEAWAIRDIAGVTHAFTPK
jgi:hypothetical protein